jgi:hypothetical protein
MRDVARWPIEEQLKYHGARFAYRHRWELAPTPLPDGTRITWAQWFERRFGISLDDYQLKLDEDTPYAPEQTASERRQSNSLAR